MIPIENAATKETDRSCSSQSKFDRRDHEFKIELLSEFFN